MPRLHVRSGVNPDEPDVPVAVLCVGPDGSPGERAVARLGDYCYEGDGVLFLSGTDGWAEHTLDGHRLTVDIAVLPSAPGQTGTDPAAFPDRSTADPEAVLVPAGGGRGGPGAVRPGGARDRGVHRGPGSRARRRGRPVLLGPPPED